MLIAGNPGTGWFNAGAGDGRDSFREHNQRMKEFRLAHPTHWRQWPCDEPEVQENPLALPKMLLVHEVEQCKHLSN